MSSLPQIPYTNETNLKLREINSTETLTSPNKKGLKNCRQHRTSSRQKMHLNDIEDDNDDVFDCAIFDVATCAADNVWHAESAPKVDCKM